MSNETKPPAASANGTILAFDTCLGACSVAVRTRSARGEWLLHEAYEERSTGHAEALMPMIRSVMERAGRTFAEVTRVAVTRGPGSFTGVRICVAAARGFGVALGVPLSGLSSLAVMAHRADTLLANDRHGVRRQDVVMLVAVDARKGEVYAQAFGESVADPLGEPEALSIEEAARLGGDKDLLIVGSGGALVAGAAERAGRKAQAALPSLQPHARFLALLTPALPKLTTIEPVYLRASDAKPPAATAPGRLH